jgi:hypothetical protein
MPLAPLWSIHFYGPGLMGACIATVDPEEDLTVRAEVRLGTENTVNPDEYLNLLKGNKMAVENTVSPDDSLLVRANTGLAVVSKVNELTQDDIIGAVLTTQIAPGLTFSDALKDARKSAKLAAALSA